MLLFLSPRASQSEKNTLASESPGLEWSVDRHKTGKAGGGCSAVIKTKLKKSKDACYSVFS